MPARKSTKRFFGEVPACPPGTHFISRLEASRAGVHRPTMPGISGTKDEGADSIVVSGGYEDDVDLGDLILYTGTGGNDPATKKQIADQTLDHPNNAGLVTSQLEGLPVRVVRGVGGDPVHSPTSGYRYDGLFRVSDHWSEVGKSGFRIWRYRLDKIPDSAPGGFGEPPAPAGQAKPKRAAGVVNRVVRNTVVTQWVKKIHGHRCQICSVTIAVLGGWYAEGAHIVALGKPHNGSDTTDNVLCLCPNCHVRFDNGGLYVDDELRVIDAPSRLTLGALSVHPQHVIDPDRIRAHRERWGF